MNCQSIPCTHSTEIVATTHKCYYFGPVPLLYSDAKIYCENLGFKMAEDHSDAQHLTLLKRAKV